MVKTLKLFYKRKKFYAKLRWRLFLYHFSITFRKRTSFAIHSAMALVIVFSIISPLINLNSANAATATLTPDGDFTTGWTVLGGTSDGTCAGGTHCDYIDEGSTPVTTDYVSTGTGGTTGEVEEFTMGAISNVGSATSVTIYFYMQSATNANGGTLDTVNINLRVNGTLQTASTKTPAYNAWGWHSATYTGTWDQTATDSFQLSATRTRQGSGQPSSQDDDVRIASVYATVEYSPGAAYEQSGYRWFENQDTPTSTYIQSLGGEFDEYGRSTAIGTDGSYIITGYTNSYGAGANDMLLTKFNSSGVEQWSKTWGGSGDDYGYSIILDSVGDYIAVGQTTSFGAGSADVFIAKFNSSGVEQWSKTWGGTASDIARSVFQDNLGNYVVTGTTSSYTSGMQDMFIANFNSSGVEQWSKTWGGTGYAYGLSVIQDSAGDYVVAGRTNNFGAGVYDVFIAKFNSSGVEQWSKTWGGTGNEIVMSIVQNSAGEYVITGDVESFGSGGKDMFIAKFNSSGVEQWSKTWGGTGNETGNLIATDSEGNYFITGETTSYTAGLTDVFLTKFNSSGVEQWSKTWGGTGDDQALSLALNGSNSILVSGNTASYTSFGAAIDMFINNYDSSGQINSCTSCVNRDITESDQSVTESDQSVTEVDRVLSETDQAITETDQSPVILVHVGSSQENGHIMGTVDDEQITGHIVDGSGNIYIASTTSRSGVNDVLIQKYNSTLQLQWSKKWDGGNADEPREIALDSAGDIIIAGVTNSTGLTVGGNDFFIQKYNSSGGLQWTKTWGDTGSDDIYDMVVDSSNNIYVAGRTNSTSFSAGLYDVVLQKYNSSGVEQWTKTWGGDGDDNAMALAISTAGDLFIGGYTSSTGYTSAVADYLLQKYNSSGVEQWTKTWGGNSTDYIESLTLDSSGNIFSAGRTYSTGITSGGADTVLQKYNSSGVEQWTKTWGIGTRNDTPSGILVDASGNIYLAGISGSTDNKAYLQKYNSSGVLQWTKLWSNTTVFNEIFIDTNTSLINVFGVGSYANAQGGDIVLVKTANDSKYCAGACDLYSSVETDRTVTETDRTVTETDRTVTETDRTVTVTNITGISTAARFNTVAVSSIDVGSPLNNVAQNTATTAVAEGVGFRLRLNLHVGTADATNGIFKLQYALKSGTCDTSFTGESYSDVTTSTPISYYDNPNASDTLSLTTNANDPTHSTDSVVTQEYQESGNFSVTNKIAVGQDGMWDIALKDNGAPVSTSYCFRVINSTGTNINTYSVIPEITTLPPSFNQANYRFYKGQDSVPNNTFVQTWGGTGGEYGNSFVQTSDGGYAVTGSTTSYSAGFSDMFIAKYDSSGNLSWSKTWGGTEYDLGRSIIQTTDGGFAIVGQTNSYGVGSYDMFLAKYDSSGNLSWSKTWGGTGVDFGYSLIQGSDCGYAITGYTASYGGGDDDMFIAKYDSSGNLSWSKTWGDISADQGLSIIDTSEGGYAVTGYTGSHDAGGFIDMFIAKYDSSGNLSWSKTWGGSSSDIGYSLVQTTDGGYSVTGYTSGYGGGDDDMFLAKYDSVGNLSWSKTWGNVNRDRGNSLVQTTDGGYAVTGQTASYGIGSDDMFLAKYDSVGNLSWSKTWGTTDADYGNSLVQTTDGGYVVTGGSGSDMFLAKYDYQGSIIGCVSTMCTSPTATTSSPTATTSSPTATTSSPTATTSSPTATTSSPTATVTPIVGHMTFAKTWGSTGADYGRSIVQTTDGGYAVIGYTDSYGAGSNDMYIAKYDSSGNLSWSRTWGSTVADIGHSLVQTTDGGYAVTGYTSSGNWDMFIAKYDSSGNLSWSRTWGGATGSDVGRSIVQTTDGGYAVSGETDSYGAGSVDMFIVKYDSSGNLSWSRTWGHAYFDYGYSLVQTTDGGYAITGYTEKLGDGNNDMYIVKYDSSGNLSWSRTWGGIVSDEGITLVQTTDGGYAVTGYTDSYGAGSSDMFIAKYDSSGNLSWNKTWGGSGTDVGDSLTQTSDGGYAVTGYTASYGAGGNDLFIAKYDSSGNLSWNKTWGGSGTDVGRSIVQTTDGGYVINGYTLSYGAGSSDMLLAKYDSAGNIGDCSSPMCQSPTAGTSNPTATTSSPSPTDTFQVAKAIWGETVPIPGAAIGTQDNAGASDRHDDPLRLRFTLAAAKAVSVAGANLKLQVAPRVGTCDTSFTGESYVDLSGSNAFNYYDNTNIADDTWARNGPFDPTVGTNTLWYQNYQEASGFTNRHHIKATHFGLWDISITTNDDTQYNNYCFRVVNNDNSLLNGYTRIFEVNIPPAASQQMRHGKFFDTTETVHPFYW